MVKHELPTQPEAYPARVELRPTKEVDPLSTSDPDAEIIAFDITQGVRNIGQLELWLGRSDEVVEIEWLTINEELRGQGLGKLAREAALSLILSDYPWVRTIQSTLNGHTALKNAIATPVPAGWNRKFEDPDDHLFETTDPVEALDYLSPTVHIGWVLEKHNTPTQ